MQRFLANTMIALSLAALPVSSMADDLPPTKSFLVNKAMLCDTEEGIQSVLTKIALTNKMPEGDDLPVGCGHFVPEQPIPFIVTPKYWYETSKADTLIGHFLHPPSRWEQYGYLAFTIKTPDDPQT
jgi:hypothetical protein